MKAVLFDLDGVITDTAPLHYQAWRQIAIKFGKDIDENFNEKLKGVDRAESLRRILAHIEVSVSKEQFNDLMIEKNKYYIKSLENISEHDILPGIESLMVDLKLNGIKVIIASASKNAPIILEKLALLEYVDDIANPDEIEKGKPAPDIFILAAKLAGVNIENAIGIEDAQAGIDALNSAGIKSIGIGSYLQNATKVLDSTNELNIELLYDVK